MNDPQAHSPEPSRQMGDFLVEALQRQRNAALDQVAQAETTIMMLRENLEVVVKQNHALSAMNDQLVVANSKQEEELVELRDANVVLANKMGEHAVAVQRTPGLLETLATADNPPAVMPGEPSSARGLESDGPIEPRG